MSEQMLIRNLAPGTKARLRQRALRNHTSMEAEARAALESGLAGEPLTLANRLADLRPEADVEWEPERTPMVSRPVEF
jgi:antitoxin FitA